MLGINLFAQLVAAAEPLPGQEFAEVGPEWNRRKESERRILAGVVAGRRPAGLDRTFVDRLEALARRNERTVLVELHRELAARHALDVLAEAHARRAEMWECAGEGALHLPSDLVLGIGAGGQRRKAQGGQAQNGCSQQPPLQQASRHVAVLPFIVL